MTHSNQILSSNQSKKTLIFKDSPPIFSTHALFEDELKEIFHAENELAKALPLMIENAPSSEMIDVLTSHLSETKEQVARLEEVFITFGKKDAAKKCEAISDLINESEAIIQDSEEGSAKDVGVITAAEKLIRTK